jgi:hypothetical protein
VAYFTCQVRHSPRCASRVKELVLAVLIIVRYGALPRAGLRYVLAALWLLTWVPAFVTAPQPGSLLAVPWAAIPVAVLAVAALVTASRSERDASGIGGTSQGIDYLVPR